MESAVVLHNMNVESKRSCYSSDGKVGRSGVVQEHGSCDEISFTPSPLGSLPILSQISITVGDDIRVQGMHRDLIHALIEYQ